MRLIEKSNSGSATVNFRRFPNGDFMIDFYDEGWYEWTDKINTAIYTHSMEGSGDQLVMKVKDFLSRKTK